MGVFLLILDGDQHIIVILANLELEGGNLTHIGRECAFFILDPVVAGGQIPRSAPLILALARAKNLPSSGRPRIPIDKAI